MVSPNTEDRAALHFCGNNSAAPFFDLTSTGVWGHFVATSWSGSLDFGGAVILLLGIGWSRLSKSSLSRLPLSWCLATDSRFLLGMGILGLCTWHSQVANFFSPKSGAEEGKTNKNQPKTSTNATRILPQDLRLWAYLPFFYLSESSYVCFIYNVQDF